jgi:hypothetical protein
MKNIQIKNFLGIISNWGSSPKFCDSLPEMCLVMSHNQITVGPSALSVCDKKSRNNVRKRQTKGETEVRDETKGQRKIADRLVDR